MLPIGAKLVGCYLFSGEEFRFGTDGAAACYEFPGGNLEFMLDGSSWAFTPKGGKPTLTGVRYTNMGGSRNWTVTVPSSPGEMMDLGRLNLENNEPFRLGLYLEGNIGFTLKLVDGVIVVDRQSKEIGRLAFRYDHP